MEFEEVKKMLIEAYDEYYLARQGVLKGKGKEKKIQQHIMEIVEHRVKNIFHQCPELYNYVEDDFFEYPHFYKDLPYLIKKIKEMETK